MLSITHRSSCTTFSTSNNRPVIKIETSCPIFRFIAGFVPSKLFGILGTTIKLDTCCQIVRGKKVLNFSPLHLHKTKNGLKIHEDTMARFTRYGTKG